jgi:hypothetical protein
LSAADVLEKLRLCLNSRAKLCFRDGEVLIADLGFLVEDEDAIVFDLVTSNRPDKYEKSDKRPHIYAKISDVTDCAAHAPTPKPSSD